MNLPPPWTQSDWMEHVSTWIDQELSRLDIEITGPIEQPHIRPWSTVLRIPTSAGFIFFKACSNVLSHEITLTQKISSWKPAHMPKILAANLDKSWMLMADGGTTLREVIRADLDIRHWERLLPIYADLQIKIADHLPELLALDVPGRQLDTLPDQYENLLEQKDILLLDQPEGLTTSVYIRLQGMKDRVGLLSQQLAASPVPETIHHGDLHDANIFFNDGDFVFFDWGDCSISHPFFSMRTVCVSLENSLNLEEYPPEFDRLRDVYLKSWTQYEPFENLLNTFDLASRLSPIVSALSYLYDLVSLDDSLKGVYVGAIPSLLQEFLDQEDRKDT